MQQQKMKSQLKNHVEVFTTSQVLELFNLKPERFRQWIKLKFITPYIQATGSGQTHYFIKNNLYVIGLFIHLCNAGLNRVVASHLAHEIFYDLWTETLYFEEHAWLIAVWPDNPEKKRDQLKNIEIYIGTNPVPDLRDIGTALVVNLKKVMGTIDAKIS